MSDEDKIVFRVILERNDGKITGVTDLYIHDIDEAIAVCAYMSNVIKQVTESLISKRGGIVSQTDIDKSGSPKDDGDGGIF